MSWGVPFPDRVPHFSRFFAKSGACHSPETSSVTTVNPVRFAIPNEVVMATSEASRPVAISTRPIRGCVWRAMFSSARHGYLNVCISHHVAAASARRATPSLKKLWSLFLRLLSFLRKHECRMPFQEFRQMPMRPAGGNYSREDSGCRIERSLSRADPDYAHARA